MDLAFGNEPGTRARQVAENKIAVGQICNLSRQVENLSYLETRR